MFIFALLFFCLASLNAAEEINLIWQCSKKGLWEVSWILELLSDFQVHEVEDGNYTVLKDKSIIVTGNYAGDYFSKLKEKGYRFGVIHISDETYSHPTHFYKDSLFVFRNYWHKQFVDQENVFFFPLGYKQGFTDVDLQIKPSFERGYLWSFAGGIADRPSRPEMIANMRKIPNYHIHEIFEWNDPLSLDTQSYRELLLESIFVPCPRGYWNLDSFRVYEALESGCIPIVERKPIGYFSSLFDNPPFLSVASWDEVPALIDPFLHDPIALEQLRLTCTQWWADVKKKTKEQWKSVIEKAFFDVKNKGWVLEGQTLKADLEACSQHHFPYIVILGVVETLNWSDNKKWAEIVDFLSKHSDWKLNSRQFGENGWVILERCAPSKERAQQEAAIDQALADRIILCTGPSFNRRELLIETTEKDLTIIPFKKIFLSTNDPQNLDVKFANQCPVVDSIECRGHQLDCLNCILSSIRNAVNDPECFDEDIILFKHETVFINDMYLVRKAIGKIVEGADFVSRYWAPNDFYMTNVFFLKVGAARKIFREQNLVTEFSDTYRFCEDYWTKVIVSLIPKIYKIDYSHATRKSTELGFFHIPPQKEVNDDGYWDRKNYLDLFK